MRYRINLAAMILMLMGTGLIFFACTPGGPIEEKPDFSLLDTVVFETEAGEIVIRLDKERAPETSLNFLELCGAGFYDGTYFHRVVPGLLVQGGDPNTLDDDISNDGMGGYSSRGPGTFLKAESNDLRHERGAVSMVRGDGPDTAGSQFFIVLDNVPEYDGNFTVFGRVESGLDILIALAEQAGSSLEEGGFHPEKPLVLTGCSLK